MDNLGKAAKQLNTLLRPLVAMMIQELRPKDDELSMNAAYERYGRAWIEDQRNKGNLLCRYKGNRKVLSIADIECLRTAEQEMPKPVFKKKGETGFKVIRRGQSANE